jgi:Plasmid pRiA4b ORF-3-like protein
MIFDIRVLDNRSYDEVEPLLQDYIEDAIEEFADSETGQTYFADDREGGQWIGTFIEMAYLYGGWTLSKMTKANVQEVMEYILPRKLTLLDPSDTDNAIPELVAFWTYLKQEYKFRSAGAIAKYLLSIEKKFRGWMFDPARGGITKNFMLQGMNAGYDMTTPEGREAFQTIFNEQMKANPQARPLMPSSTVPMTAPPKEVKQMLDLLGIALPEVGQPVNPADLLQQIMNKIDTLDSVLNEDDEDEDEDFDDEDDEDDEDFDDEDDEDFDDEDDEDDEEEQTDSFSQALRSHGIDEEHLLSAEQIALLEAQTITETGPGTILQDFQTVLDFIGEEGIPISSKRHQIALNLLTALNQRLSHPIAIALQRPQQQSYPQIHGLYLLVRATGIASIVAQGKQYRLMLNPPIYESWQQLNPTERYFTLLEAWLIRGHGEMLGDDRAGYFNEGARCLRDWQSIASQQKHTYSKDTDQDILNRWPGLHNIGLMELFGLLAVTSGKPKVGKGWRIRSLEALPWGNALMSLVKKAYFASNFQFASETDPTVPFNELQPELQPYFPDWQKSLAVPTRQFRPGRHIFKVSLGKIWRRIAMSGEATLANFSGWILESVEFDDDHLDLFTYNNEVGRAIEVLHPYADGDLQTDRVKIGDLPLTEGSVMKYLFDFGDCWEFEVQLEKIEEPEPESEPDQGLQKNKKSKRRKSRSQKPLGEILEVFGEAPPQYGNDDDDW